jgi:hypothetical protein
MRYAWMPAVLLVLASRTSASQTISAPTNPTTLTITNAVAGSQPLSVTVPAVNYTATTPNPANRTYKITASLNSALPVGVTLTATMTAPAGGGASAGAVSLSTTAADLVTGIPRSLTNSPGTITYQLSATVAAGVVTSTSRIVTLTIVQFP